MATNGLSILLLLSPTFSAASPRLARLLPLGPQPAFPQEVSSRALRERVAEIAEQALEADEVEGLSVALAVGDDLLLGGGWGDAPDGSAAGAASPWPAASLLEQLTVAALLRLVGQGELELDAPIARTFPALAREGEVITLAHLLSHTSGLPPRAELLREGEQASFEEVLASIATVALDSTPGECFAYSDTDQLLLARLLEELTGSELADHLSASLIEPLGLESTEPGPLEGRAAALVSQEPGDQDGAGGSRSPWSLALRSTAQDLLRWQRGLVGREVLEEREYRLMTEAWELDDGTTTGAGCGVSRTSLEDFEGYSYGGGVDDARVHVAYYPPLDLTIVVLALSDAGVPAQIERRIARAVFDLPEPGVHDRALPPELRDLYSGGYQIGCNRVTIEARGERLAYVSVDEGFELLYQGARHAFVSADDPETRIVFDLEDGRVTGFTLDEAGVRTTAVRFEQG